MLLLVQLQYAKDAHSVPIPPPTEQKMVAICGHQPDVFH